MHRPSRTDVIRHGSAVLGVAVATAARLALDPILGDLFPFATLFFAVLVVAAYAGRGPALLATGLGALASARFLLPPRDSLAVLGAENQAGMVLYLAVGSGISLLGGALRDARRRAEGSVVEAVRQREQLRVTLASIGDAVIVTDAEGRVTSLNPVAGALTGWSSSEAAGQPLSRVFRIANEETRREVENPAVRALREGAVVDLANHTLLIARDGTERPIDDSAAPIKDDRGVILGVVLVFRDVTARRRSEEEVGRQAKLLSGILAASVDHIYLVDGEGRYGEVSVGGARALGLDPAALKGKHWRELGLPADVMGPFDAQREQVLRSGQAAAREVAFRAPGGEERIFEYVIAPLGGAGGADGVVVVSRDVTERRRAEQAIRRAEERSRTILESITDAFCALDRDWRFVYVNRQAEVLLGRASGDLLGKGHWDEYPATLGTDTERHYRRAATEGVAVTFEMFYPPHDRWYEVNAYPADGGLSVYFRDITARKRWEAEHARLVAASEQQRRTYETVLSSTPDFNYVLDLEGRFTFVNAALLDLWRRPLDEALGRDFSDLGYPPDLAARLHRQIRQVVDTRRPVRDETPFTSHPGDREHESIFVPVMGAGGEVEAVAGSTRDITDRKRAEEALRESEERFRAAVDQAAVGVAIVGLDHRTTFANRGLCEMLGYTEAEMLSKSFIDVTHPDDIELDFRRMPALLSGEVSSCRYEKRYLRRDGSVMWGDLSVSAVRDGRGELKSVVAVLVDITEKKRAEEALRQGEERLRLIVESATDYAIFTQDLDGTITTWNSGARNLVGYEQGEIVGRDSAILFIPEDIERGVPGQEIRKALDLGRAENERWHVRKDGTTFWASGLLMPMRDGDEVVGLLKIMRDTTEQKRTEQELEISRSRLDLVVNSSEVGLWYCDLPFGKLVWNAKCKEHFGLPPGAEVTIDTFYGRLHPDDREPTRRGIERSIEGHTEYDIEFRALDPHGRVRWVRAIGQPFYDVEGTPIRFDGITVDVTQRIMQEEALQEADRRKDEFLATLAHELRNPLAPIRNALHLMRQADGDGPMEPERAMAERQVVHLARLIDDLMDVARITRGKIELHKEVLDLATIVNQAVETARPQVDEHRHRLTVSLPEEAVRLEGDPTRLEQVLWNLLNNAAKYSEPGGHIRLTVAREGDEAVVTVRDTGIGIRPEMLPRVFEMFVQVDDHKGHARGGLGIGLSLVKTLVEMHGGSIAANSDGPGLGSEFEVRLPVLSRSRGMEAADRGRRRDPDERLPARRILVVDDNVDAARSLARLLSRLYGQEVRVAHDGPEALVAAEEFRPEVVLLDIGLPGMDGNEVARRLRERPEFRATLLVALTGWGQESDVERSREAGFDRHLVKPADPESIRLLLIDREATAG